MNGSAGSSGTTDVWLPAGTYELVEVWYPNEINWGGDPLYVSLVGSAYRPIGSIDITPGSTHSFVEEVNITGNPNADSDWIPERAACLGQAMPSLGSGSVQVSLNWPEDGIDLDLYVTDPSGDEIFYGNHPVATAPASTGPSPNPTTPSTSPRSRWTERPRVRPGDAQD